MLVLVVAGCGSAKLTREENSHVYQVEQAVNTNVLNGSGEAQTATGVDWLIALYRRKPDAKHDGRTVRQVLSDLASQVDPSAISRKIDRALKAGP